MKPNHLNWFGKINSFCHWQIDTKEHNNSQSRVKPSSQDFSGISNTSLLFFLTQAEKYSSIKQIHAAQGSKWSWTCRPFLGWNVCGGAAAQCQNWAFTAAAGMHVEKGTKVDSPETYSWQGAWKTFCSSWLSGSWGKQDLEEKLRTGNIPNGKLSSRGKALLLVRSKPEIEH